MDRALLREDFSLKSGGVQVGVKELLLFSLLGNRLVVTGDLDIRRGERSKDLHGFDALDLWNHFALQEVIAKLVLIVPQTQNREELRVSLLQEVRELI